MTSGRRRMKRWIVAAVLLSFAAITLAIDL